MFLDGVALICIKKMHHGDDDRSILFVFFDGTRVTRHRVHFKDDERCRPVAQLGVQNEAPEGDRLETDPRRQGQDAQPPNGITRAFRNIPGLGPLEPLGSRTRWQLRSFRHLDRGCVQEIGGDLRNSQL